MNCRPIIAYSTTSMSKVERASEWSCREDNPPVVSFHILPKSESWKRGPTKYTSSVSAGRPRGTMACMEVMAGMMACDMVGITRRPGPAWRVRAHTSIVIHKCRALLPIFFWHDENVALSAQSRNTATMALPPKVYQVSRDSKPREWLWECWTDIAVPRGCVCVARLYHLRL